MVRRHLTTRSLLFSFVIRTPVNIVEFVAPRRKGVEIAFLDFPARSLGRRRPASAFSLFFLRRPLRRWRLTLLSVARLPPCDNVWPSPMATILSSVEHWSIRARLTYFMAPFSRARTLMIVFAGTCCFVRTAPPALWCNRTPELMIDLVSK